MVMKKIKLYTGIISLAIATVIFLFVLGFSCMQYFSNQDVDFIAWVFSGSSLLIYTGSVFVLSLISGYLIKNQ